MRIRMARQQQSDTDSNLKLRLCHLIVEFMRSNPISTPRPPLTYGHDQNWESSNITRKITCVFWRICLLFLRAPTFYTATEVTQHINSLYPKKFQKKCLNVNHFFVCFTPRVQNWMRADDLICDLFI